MIQKVFQQTLILVASVTLCSPVMADHAIGHNRLARANIFDILSRLDALTQRVETLESQNLSLTARVEGLELEKMELTSLLA